MTDFNFLDAKPAPFVSMFVHMRSEKVPTMVLTGVPLDMVERVMARLCGDWEATKPGRKSSACPINGFERFLKFSDGKVAGSIFADPLPVEPAVSPS